MTIHQFIEKRHFLIKIKLLNNFWSNNFYKLAKILMNLPSHSFLTNNNFRSSGWDQPCYPWNPLNTKKYIPLSSPFILLLTNLKNTEIEILRELAYKLTLLSKNLSSSFYFVNFINLHCLWEILNGSNMSVVLSLEEKLGKYKSK